MKATVRIPTDLITLTIAGMARRGPMPEPVTEGTRHLFQFYGLRGKGTTVTVSIDHDDTDALDALRRARTDDHALVELLALLAVVLELDGTEGAWSLERVAELLYGPRDRKASNRHRELAGVKAWVTLLTRATLNVDAPVKKGTGRLGGHVGGTLLTIEPAAGRKATVHVESGFAKHMREGVGAVVPVATFDLRKRRGSTPRKGGTPSAAQLARVRVGAAICAKWHWRSKGRRDDHHAQAVTAEELVGTWAGMDAEKITATKRWPVWTDAIVRDLRATHKVGGVGLDGTPLEWANPARSTLLALAHRWRSRRQVVVKTRAGGSQNARSSGASGSQNARSTPENPQVRGHAPSSEDSMRTLIRRRGVA